ncbi:LysR family transcriptional regulator [Occultella gossypii]|uniref:LysR family transcriptional regulator n=1 Tax=Occultella gossypii TaxID=2800820 RepID=A0ABS7SCG6_9MICO|nr:LysR family transcriptional regulator [Occultella gossypii]MBZ2197394.1 LysR family transcriptional regulator [Occultella gossypii]
MMDEAKLEAFVAVAEEESFSAAADRIRVAQSTISARIKELEAELGQPVFIRTSRRVRLAPAGTVALPAARTALAALSALRQVVDDVAGVRRGRVRLGLLTGADLPELAQLLADFAAEFPGIELVVSSASAQDLHRAVSDSALDLAVVVRAGAAEVGGPAWVELLSDPLTVVGLDRAAGPVPVTELAKVPLILLDAAVGARGVLEAAARSAGARLDIAVEVSTPSLATDLFAQGMGALVIPASLAPRPGSVITGADGAELSVSVGLISHPTLRTPAADLLLGRLRVGLTAAG